MVWTPTPRRPRAAGQYTTLAEELRNIDRYLNLERARFGAALNVRLQVAPEVLNVVVPFLALQPLVENAVRHGFAGKGGGSVEIIARDEGSDCVITVEDDGVGMDPETLRTGPGDALSDGAPAKEAHVGLTNVDHRLRAAFATITVWWSNGDRRGHQGRDAGAEVPVGCSGQRRCVRVIKP